MLNQDAMQIKENIISLLRMNGPSLPVHIAKGTGLSILFASAFLSELFYEKKVNISNLKIGNSPLYFLPGQEPQLERFSQYLKSKEKEAFNLLKEKKFLKDSEQQPAIRVALREIKDFAIPFKREEEIYWRYFTVPEEELEKKPEKEIVIQEKSEKELGIFEKEEIKRKEKKKPSKKKISKKKEGKFFNKVKEFLSEKNIEILDIQSFNKNDLMLKIKENEEEKILIAYNKKRISNMDLIKACKKSIEENLPYVVLSLGEPAKNLRDLISAIKNLSGVDTLRDKNAKEKTLNNQRREKSNE
jgi:hypothetical protein